MARPRKTVTGSSNPLINKKRERKQQPIAKLPAEVDEIRLQHPKVTAQQADLVEFILSAGATQKQASEFFDFPYSYVSRTVRLPHVVDYSMALVKATMSVRALQAIAVQGELLNSRSDRVRADVAADILNRAGVGASTTGAPGVNIQMNLSPGPGGPKDMSSASPRCFSEIP